MGLSSLPHALPCRSRVPQFSASGAADCGDSSPNILLSTFNCRLLTSPRGSFLVPIPARNPFKHLHLQLSLDSDGNHVVICYLILSNHFRRTAPQAAPLRNLCVRRLPRLPAPAWSGPRASRGPGRGVPPRSLLTFNFELLTSSSSIFQPLDFSSLGLTLNFQSEVRRLSRPEIPTRSGLSTFNRVSFLSPSSPHLCALCVLCGENSSSFHSSLIPRHSPLTTNSFIIRTSETPLPQLLYNPHLQAPLGSAGNKGLITPLESALTKNSPVSRLESALAEKWGWGVILATPEFATRHSSLPTMFKPFLFRLFHTLLRFLAPAKNSTLLFSCNSELFAKNAGGWVPPLHCSPGKTATHRMPLSKVMPPTATVATLPGKVSARLYSPPRRSPLAGVRQKYRTNPQRTIPDRESARRKPGFSRADKRLSAASPQDSCPEGCRQQFCPAHCFLSDRHARTSVLWDFNTSRAGGRWHDGERERLGIAEEQGGSGSRQRSAAKSESAGHFSQCLLSTDVAAHRRPGVDLRGDHPWGQ